MGTREAPQRSSRTKARVENEGAESTTTLRRLQARGERLLQWFPELRKTWQRDAEPSLEALLGQLQSLGGQVSRRAQETGRELEARAERVLADLERQAVRGLGPLLSRANLASSSELSNIEQRLTQLESRLAPLVEDAAKIAARVTDVQRGAEDARADAEERARDVSVRLSGVEELRLDLGNVHTQLEALSKDQVTRSLELGKLHDRLIRLEIRMGDVLREHGNQLAAQHDMARKLDDVDRTVGESSRSLQSLREQTQNAASEARGTDGRLTALAAARNGDHDEIGRLADLLGTVQQTLRQVDLRLGDLSERYTGVREELAALAARVSHVELAATPSAAAPSLGERTEGH